MHEYVIKGLLISILKGQRCQKCLKKQPQCCCSPSQEGSPTKKLQRPILMAQEMGNGNEKLFIVPKEDFVEEP